MRSYQVFAAMTPDQAVSMMRGLSDKAPAVFRQAVDAAAMAIKARPVYLRKQPFEKRAEAVRRAAALAHKDRATLGALKRRLFETVVAALEEPLVF